jgi:Uma2 family endonuclease
MERPTVIIEVLSDSTGAFDRGEKFRAYRRLGSFKEYVLIDPEARRVEVFRREGATQRGTLEELGTGSPLELRSLGVSLPWEAVFENVTPPAR